MDPELTMRVPTSPTPASISAPDRARKFGLLRFDRVEPDREQIHKLLRLQPGRDGHRRWFDLVDQSLGALPRLMRPRGVFRIDDVTALEPHGIDLSSGAKFEGTLGAYLRHSRFIATFIVTLGSAVERLSRTWLRAGKVMQGTIADAIASEAAEATAQRLQSEVRHWAQSQGLDITPAYSPGYCGLTVRQQLPLFASLPAAQINVRLTASCLMLPIKSISGLIGIGPPDKVNPDAYPCEACEHPDCVQRRAAFRHREQCSQAD